MVEMNCEIIMSTKVSKGSFLLFENLMGPLVLITFDKTLSLFIKNFSSEVKSVFIQSISSFFNFFKFKNKYILTIIPTVTNPLYPINK